MHKYRVHSRITQHEKNTKHTKTNNIQGDKEGKVLICPPTKLLMGRHTGGGRSSVKPLI
jgi:hypothetical protein